MYHDMISTCTNKMITGNMGIMHVMKEKWMNNDKRKKKEWRTITINMTIACLSCFHAVGNLSKNVNVTNLMFLCLVI